MALRVLIDENTSPGLIDYLEETRIEATHVLTTVGAGSSDKEIVGYAAEHGYAVLSHDTDFITSEHAEPVPVIYYTDDTISIDSLGTQIQELNDYVESNSDLASITYLSNWE